MKQNFKNHFVMKESQVHYRDNKRLAINYDKFKHGQPIKTQ